MSAYPDQYYDIVPPVRRRTPADDWQGNISEIEQPPMEADYVPAPTRPAPRPEVMDIANRARGNELVRMNLQDLPTNLQRRAPELPSTETDIAPERVPYRDVVPPPTRPGRVPLPPRQGYRAQAEQEIGPQKSRRWYEVLADIAGGFGAGGIGTAIGLGAKGGDIRYQNRINARANDIAQADQAGREEQQYHDRQQQIEFDNERKLRREELEDREFGMREREFNAKLGEFERKSQDYDPIVGWDDQNGRYGYYRKTPKGLESLGVGAAEPKGAQQKVDSKEIEARAQNTALLRYQQKYPQGKPDPNWIIAAQAWGYDPSKPASDPANMEARQIMAMRMPNVRYNADPNRDPEFQQYLREEQVKLYDQSRQQQDQYGRGQQVSSPGQMPAAGNQQVQSGRFTEQDQMKYLELRGKPGVREAFQQKFGVDPEQIFGLEPVSPPQPRTGRTIDVNSVPRSNRSAQPVANRPQRPAPTQPTRKAPPIQASQPAAQTSAQQQTVPPPPAKPTQQGETRSVLGLTPEQRNQQAQTKQQYERENQAVAEWDQFKQSLGNMPYEQYNQALQRKGAELQQRYGYNPMNEAPLMRGFRQFWNSSF